MSTQYLNIDARKQWELSRRGYCPFCAKDHKTDDCYARHCDSCSAAWLAGTPKDSDDGRPRVETCPDCIREGFGSAEETFAFLQAEGKRIAEETAAEAARKFDEFANELFVSLRARFAEIDERKVSVPDLEQGELLRNAEKRAA